MFKSHTPALLHCLFAGILLFAGAPVFAEVHWEKDFDAAKTRAKAEHKFILMDIDTEGCYWCQQLDKFTFTDQAVEKLLDEHFVCVKARDGVEPEVKARGVKSFPTEMIYDQDGFHIGTFVGYKGPLHYLACLKALTKIEDKPAK